MEKCKMTGNFYEDVLIFFDMLENLGGMVTMLEEERMIKDKGKGASELFIMVNGMKRGLVKMISDGKDIVRKADIERYGSLSKYIRPYLAY